MSRCLKEVGDLKHGCQIVVQLEQERVLKKQIRKEEKRFARKEKDLLALHSFTTDLDVNVLRKIREQELQEAALRPLLTGQGHHYSVSPSELYPHVYDSLAGVLHSAAVVGGAKVGCFVVYCSLKCACTLTHMYMHMHTHTCAHSHTRTHACTHARTLTCTHTHAHTHTHTCTHTHTHTHARSHAHAHMHTHTHTLAHTHTHTHSHTHIWTW